MQLKPSFLGFLLIIMLIPTLLLTGCVDSWSWGTGWSLGFLSIFLFSLIVPIIIIVLIVLLIRWLIKKSKEQSPQQQEDDRYLGIAKERYAKGEISHDEFEQIKKDLS